MPLSKIMLLQALCLLLLCTSCTGQSKRSNAPRAKTTAVAFYNLENMYDAEDDPKTDDDDFTPNGANHYTESMYKEKLQHMAYALSQLALDKNADGPALIGLAEVENRNVLQALVQQPELRTRNLKIVHFDSPDHRGIDVALLYHPGYFVLLHAQALPLSLSRNGRQERSRDVLYVTGKLGKDTVHVFVNHWPSRREGEDNSAWKRRQAARVSKKVIDSLMLRNKNTRCIVMGDLNDDPVDESVSQTLAATGDRLNIKPGGLFNPWLSIFKQGKGTAAYRNQWNLFDQILLSYGFVQQRKNSSTFSEAAIFNPAFLQNSGGRQKGYPYRSFSSNRWIRGYSDHFPTIVYLSE